MLELPAAMTLSTRLVAQEFIQAGPHAPAVPEPPRRRRGVPMAQARRALAGALTHAARVVAPPECSPAR